MRPWGSEAANAAAPLCPWDGNGSCDIHAPPAENKKTMFKFVSVQAPSIHMYSSNGHESTDRICRDTTETEQMFEYGSRRYRNSAAVCENATDTGNLFGSLTGRHERAQTRWAPDGGLSGCLACTNDIYMKTSDDHFHRTMADMTPHFFFFFFCFSCSLLLLFELSIVRVHFMFFNFHRWLLGLSK